MLIGGVMLGSGMELALGPRDYQDGDTRLRFILIRIIEVRPGWILLDGVQCPGVCPTWTPRQLLVRITALKHSLVLAEAA